MRRIENEQGCTLSSSAETNTSGRSQVPSLLRLQIMDEVTELFLRITSPTKTAKTMLIVIVIFFMALWGYVYFELKFNYITVLVFKENRTLYQTDSGRAMSVWVIHNFYIKRSAGVDNSIRDRKSTRLNSSHSS